MARTRLADRRARQRKHKERELRLARAKVKSVKRPKMANTPIKATLTTANKAKAAQPATKASTAPIKLARHAEEQANGGVRKANVAIPQAPATPTSKLDPATPISDLNLPEELFAKLDRIGIKTIEQFQIWSKGALSSAGLNRTMMAILEERVVSSGYAFKPDRPRKSGK